ncbi:MAG: hypothetical protein KDB14_28165 [Planctomycetales bacterium]|nr:hypothetical protein [Planctomycetales bacterium]
MQAKTIGTIELLDPTGRFDRLVESPELSRRQPPADPVDVEVIADVETLRADLSRLFESLAD